MASRDFKALSLRRAARARALSTDFPEAADLLSFLARVCELQARVDPASPLASLPELAELARVSGSSLLAANARNIDHARCATAMRNYLRTADSAEPDAFFARVLLMPVAADASDPAALEQACERALGGWLTAPDAGGFTTPGTLSPCPWCAHPPQLVVLTPDGHGTRTSLACSLCLRTHDTTRGKCAGCGQEDERRLSYYAAEPGSGASEADHEPSRRSGELVVCDVCHAYLHVETADSEVFVGDVDEVAHVALDAWAVQQGWHKVHANVLGL